MKIAVIGSGISGLGAAWLLDRNHDVTVFEKACRPGGHSNTVDVNYDGLPISVDTGFIVYNELNYPNLTALFEHLDVRTEQSDMSFSFSSPTPASEWSGDNLDTVFTYRRNIFNPAFLGMISGILRFNQRCLRDLNEGMLEGMSLGQYLDLRNYGATFRDRYLLPMGAAIWSTSLQDMLDFPAASFVRFFANHRLINATRDRPVWRTVSGGSRQYVNKIAGSLRNGIRLGAQLKGIRRETDRAVLIQASGEEEYFDQVILACHSDQALKLLLDPADNERELLGDIRYSSNIAVLHRDQSLMPRRYKAWASWNYMSDSKAAVGLKPASVTYWMNRLQNIDRQYPLFVSLNPSREPAPEKTFAVLEYDHPLFDGRALRAQKRLDEIQGIQNTWYCGAWFGYGFHEDGLASGLDVAERLGATRPWHSGRMGDAAEREPLQAAE